MRQIETNVSLRKTMEQLRSDNANLRAIIDNLAKERSMHGDLSRQAIADLAAERASIESERDAHDRMRSAMVRKALNHGALVRAWHRLKGTTTSHIARFQSIAKFWHSSRQQRDVLKAFNSWTAFVWGWKQRKQTAEAVVKSMMMGKERRALMVAFGSWREENLVSL